MDVLIIICNNTVTVNSYFSNIFLFIVELLPETAAKSLDKLGKQLILGFFDVIFDMIEDYRAGMLDF